MARTPYEILLYGPDAATAAERRRQLDAARRQMPAAQPPTGLGMGQNGLQQGLNRRPSAPRTPRTPAPIAPTTPRTPAPAIPRTPAPRTPARPNAQVPTGLGMGPNGYQPGINPPRTTAPAPRPERLPSINPKPYNPRPMLPTGLGLRTPGPNLLGEPMPLDDITPAVTRPAPVSRGTGSPGAGLSPQYTPQDESVSNRLQRILAQDSPLLQQARTRGLQAANQRGLLNSSLGIQAAEAAMIDQAMVIARQEAQQAAQANQQMRGILSQELRDVAAQAAARQRLGMELSSRERVALRELNQTRELNRQSGLSQSMAQIEATYRQAIATITGNDKIPSATRQAYLDQAAKVRDSSYRLLEQLYRIQLKWSSNAPRPVAGPEPSRPPGTRPPLPRPGGPVGITPPRPGGFTGLGNPGNVRI